jgi:hypothetical protein
LAALNLFPKTPSFSVGGGVISFDAVLEDTLEAEVTYPAFPLEIGANATDHGIIQPILWSIRGAVSNNPLSAGVREITGIVTNFFDPTAAIAVAGLTSAFLAGSDATRAGATLQLLLGLMYQREPFDIDAGDIQLSNMVITNISRTKTAQNETGLEFVAELMELPLISTVISSNQPGQSILPAGDPAQTQATSLQEKGEVLGTETSQANTALASEVL